MKFTTTKNQKKPGWLLLFLFILLLQARAFAQQTAVQVIGKVTDEKGETMPGVNVRLKGTQAGASTDVNGKFSLSVPGGKGTLVFSFLGYLTQEIPLNGQATFTVNMVGDPKSLKEVVVIGYGSQKRETVTDAITTVKAEDFNKGNITDPITLIQGKVAGLSISRSSGSDPNAMADFQLRGPSSVFSATGPLIVIDGVPGGDIQMIAPQDIASIDVLKDASAAAIYGERGSAGVIIVTTKKGKPGTSTITYDGNVSADYISKKYTLLDASQYVALGKKYNQTVINKGANTNWLNQLMRTPYSNSHNLSLSGGTEKTTYYAAVDYRNLQGLDQAASRQFVEGTARVNTKALNDKLNFTVSIMNSYDNKSYSNRGALAQTLNLNPTYPVKNPDGTYFENPGAYNLEWNPVENEKLSTNNDLEKRLQGIADLSYTIIPGFVADVNYNTRREDYLNGTYTANNEFFQTLFGTNGQASRTETNITDNVVQATLNYSKQIKKHHFDLIGGYSYQDTFNDGFSAGNNNFTTNAYLYYNLGAGSALNNITPNFIRNGVYEATGSNGVNDRYLSSFFGRVIYDFDEKYLFKASIRRDGSSVLSAGNKFGNYYGISGGWVVSRESFLESSNLVKFLKLRVSYGTTGNDQALSPYQSLTLLSPFTTNSIEDGSVLPQDGYVGNGTTGGFIVPIAPANNVNTQLRFEEQKEIDAGIDFTLFNSGWLTGTVDYYNKKINNLLGTFPAQVPSNIYSTISANAGSFQDSGFELTLNAKAFKTQNFGWNITFTGAYNKNKVISLSGGQYQGTVVDITNINGSDLIQRLGPGQPMDEFYGRVFAGFASDGSWLFRNAAGKAVPDSQIDPSTDYKFLGSGLPVYNLSLTNAFHYKNFDASFMLRSALGFKAVNANRLLHENLSTYSTSNLFVSTLQPKNVVNANETFSSYYIENGNYMKLDNLSIGYNVPFKSGSGVKNLRFSFSAINVFTITGFSGINPELPLTTVISQNEGQANPGVEALYNYYPATRTLTLGVTATF